VTSWQWGQLAPSPKKACRKIFFLMLGKEKILLEKRRERNIHPELQKPGWTEQNKNILIAIEV